MPLLRIGARIITGRVSPTSFIGPLISLAGIVALTFLLVTGRIDLSKFDTGAIDPPEIDATLSQEGIAQEQPAHSPVQPVVGGGSDRIRLGSINWRAVNAGAGQSQWLNRLVTMLRDFDVVAFQQVEPGDYALFQRLTDQLAQSSSRYQFIASNEMGRGALRERSVFLWNQDRVMLIPDSNYGIVDDADRLLIEPYVASFEVRIAGQYGRASFRFCLMNVHCREDVVPSQTRAEWDVLRDVYYRVRQFEYERRREDDVIFLGDFASSIAKQTALMTDPLLSPVIQASLRSSSAGTTQEFLMDAAATREFTGRCGAFRLDQQLGLPISGATEGMLLAWIELSAEESMALGSRSPVEFGTTASNAAF